MKFYKCIYKCRACGTEGKYFEALIRKRGKGVILLCSNCYEKAIEARAHELNIPIKNRFSIMKVRASLEEENLKHIMRLIKNG